MLKTKYYYNPSTCSYEQAQTSTLVLVLRIFVFILFSIGLSIVIVRYYHGHFISPREEQLLRNKKELESYYYDVQKKIESSTELLATLQKQDDDLYRILLNAPPLSTTERNASMVGVEEYAHLGKGALIAQTLSKADQLISQLKIQKKSYDQISNLAKKNSSILRSMPTLPPLTKEHLKRISGHFGMRPHPIFKILRMHEGVDFAAPIRTPIYAAADGYIKWIKRDRKGYGNHVLIEHGNGFQTHYAHMYTIVIKERDRIIRGQQIGTVGNSGDATGPHLHYEVYCNGRRVNPVQYFVGELTASEYEAIRKKAAHPTQALCSNF